jgi:hypothetical protein
VKTEQQPNYNIMTDNEFEFKPYTPPKQNVNVFLIIAGVVFAFAVIYFTLNKNETTDIETSKNDFNQSPASVKSIDEQKIETSGNNSTKVTQEINETEVKTDAIGEQIDNYIKYNDICIKDLSTNFYWYIAPDKSFSFEEANNFAVNIKERNLNWRIPTFDEIRTLYNSDYSAGEGFFINNKYYPAKINNVFNSIGSGSWFWVSDVNNNISKAYAINLHEGIKISFDNQAPKYPVHLLLTFK